MAQAKLSQRDSNRVVYVGDKSGFDDLLGAHSESNENRLAVEVVTTIDTALGNIVDQPPDCLLLDCETSKDTSTEHVQRIRDENPALPVITLVGAGNEEMGRQTVRAGATDCLHKDLVTGRGEILTTRIENVITAQRSNQQVSSRPDNLSQILNTVPTAVTQANRLGEIIYANQHAQDELGIEPSEVTDRTYNDPQWDITDLDGNPLPDEELPFNRVMSTGEPVRSFQHNITWPDGRTRTVEINGSPLFDDEGDVESVVFSISDVTEQQKRIDRLEKYEKYLDNSPDIVHILTEDGTVEYQSETHTQAYDFELNDILGADPGTVIHPDDLQQVQADFEQTLASGPDETITTEFRVEAKDGEYHWFENRTTNYLNHDPINGILVTSRNIDERKAHEEEIEAERAFTQQILDALNDIFFVVDTDGTIQRWNQQVVDVTGYTPEEIDGMRSTNLFDHSERADIVEAIGTILRDGETVVEAKLKTEDGELIPYEWSGSRLTNTDGETIGIVGIGRDISDRKQKQAELDHTKRQLKTVLSKTNTGAWTLDVNEDAVSRIIMPEELGLDHKSGDIESYLDQIKPNDRDAVENAIDSAVDSRGKFDTQFRLADESCDRWLRAHGNVMSDDGSLKVVGVTTEITERVHRTKALQKRERVLHKLHTAAQELYKLNDKHAVAEVVISLLEEALDLDYATLTLLDQESATLQPVASTPLFDELTLSFDSASSGSNPVWDAYRTGEKQTATGTAVDQLFDDKDGRSEAIDYLLATPIGDIGVLMVCDVDRPQFDTVDTDLIDIITTNATAAFEGIATAEKRGELSDQLAVLQERMEGLEQIVDSMQTIETQVLRAESRSEMYEIVCSELVALDSVDFAWVGRPMAADNEFDMIASAGGGKQYIDAIVSGAEASRLPAYIAAERCEMYINSDIAEDVRDKCWAKEALSAGYRTVLSIPLVRDGVVYDVITVYSSDVDGFTEIHEMVLENISSLTLNHARMIDRQRDHTDCNHTIVKFNFADNSYPLQELADRSDSKIQFDTVVRSTGESITLMIEIVEGDRQSVPQHANDVSGIRSVRLIGTDESQQVLVELTRPCRLHKIEKHGGQIMHSISAPDENELCLQIVDRASVRPVLDYVASQFDHTELIAKEDAEKLDAVVNDPIDSLTDRQLEILNAAYCGGYYETPREINGEDLAESFDISSPVIYNHLQAAHRKILGHIFDSDTAVENHVLDS
jgi:PAS domain S-box-containing protein